MKEKCIQLCGKELEKSEMIEVINQIRNRKPEIVGYVCKECEPNLTGENVSNCCDALMQGDLCMKCGEHSEAFCYDCEGTGEVCIPAHQRAGEIVDEECSPCRCKLNML